MTKIVLVGYRGSGKTTLGKHLASHLNIPFVDTDHLIESKAGMSIPEIFQKEGEEGFRLRETMALKEALLLNSAVIATGGGIVLRPENRILMRKSDLIVYLVAPLSVLVERIRGDDHRPPLTSLPLEEEVMTTLKQRIPLYEEVADIILDTSRYSVEEATREILKKVKKEEACSEPLCS
ncbi:MAG: shikimate kinase AroL [Brevinematales bacterium]|nr:shikimate kinase AroL [Brevinematales bacterium]